MIELRDGLDTLWRAVNGDGGDVARVGALAEALLPPDDPWVNGYYGLWEPVFRWE
jgi:hypothetical protein